MLNGGCLTRRTDTEHARRLPLKLTAEGQAILAQAGTLAPSIDDTLLANFSADERAMLKRLLTRLVQRLDSL
jgi:DNA-binding MarR family transcriptional regulator